MTQPYLLKLLSKRLQKLLMELKLTCNHLILKVLHGLFFAHLLGFWVDHSLSLGYLLLLTNSGSKLPKDLKTHPLSGLLLHCLHIASPLGVLWSSLNFSSSGHPFPSSHLIIVYHLSYLSVLNLGYLLIHILFFPLSLECEHHKNMNILIML